jgi:hypothetical protein
VKRKGSSKKIQKKRDMLQRKGSSENMTRKGTSGSITPVSKSKGSF